MPRLTQVEEMIALENDSVYGLAALACASHVSTVSDLPCSAGMVTINRVGEGDIRTPCCDNQQVDFVLEANLGGLTIDIPEPKRVGLRCPQGEIVCFVVNSMASSAASFLVRNLPLFLSNDQVQSAYCVQILL